MNPPRRSKAPKGAPHQAAVRHRRTRNDHATETAEDYVEAVAALVESEQTCRVRDLARQFGVSHVTVIRTVARLQREGLLHSEPYGPISLTRQGRALAQQSRQRHATVFQFLRALGVSQATAEIDTEGIEHHVSRETLRCMKRFIDQAR